MAPSAGADVSSAAAVPVAVVAPTRAGATAACGAVFASGGAPYAAPTGLLAAEARSALTARHFCACTQTIQVVTGPHSKDTGNGSVLFSMFRFGRLVRLNL